MTTTASAPSSAVTTPASTRIAYRAMRGLLTFFGLFSVLAASYFGFVVDAADGGIANGFDLFVTLWKIGIGIAFLVAAIGPRLERRQRIAVARWAMAAELVFDAIKLGYYHESAALVFVVVDCLLAVLVLRAGQAVRAA